MMAEGGKELSDSLRDSDYLYEFPCSPCEKDGRNVEAINYCTDCDENLCPTCLSHHNKFATTRGHKVLDQVRTSQGQTKQLPSQRCSKHGGKVIDVFCPEHDIVGCSTCISVDHSSCEGKQFIPDMAVGIKASQELKQLETEMKTVTSKLDGLKKLKGDDIERLKQDKDDIKKQIQFIRKKMNEQLDKMEKELLLEADTKFKEKIDAIHASIAEVDDMLARLKHAMIQLKSDKDDADIFVSCKMVKQEMSKEIHPLHARVEKRLPGRSFEIHIIESAQQIMEGRMIIGSINEKFSIQNAEYKEDINIALLSDGGELCGVLAMCALPDGCLVMSDLINYSLKKVDRDTNSVSTLISLPGAPAGMCMIDHTRIAVALHTKKKIQFVSLSGQVTLDNSFSVGDICRGLAHSDGLLYVCCGGSRNPDNKEGAGHVEIYTIDGELLRCLYEDFGCPLYISVINDGYNTTIYTADHYKGVQVRGMDGVVKHRFSTALGTQLPFCLIGTDQLCIGECSTGKIVQQTYKDKRILIKKKEIKGGPLCLYFDERSSQLFVALFRSDVIKVFDLHIE